MNEREQYTLKIADIIFCIDSYPDAYTKSSFAPYIVSDWEEEDIVRVHCSYAQGTIEVPASDKLTQRGDGNWYSDGEGRYTMIFTDPDDGFVCARIDYDNNAKSAELVLVDVASVNGTDAQFFLCNIIERLFRLVLVFYGGFTVHSSSVIHQGYGVAFSALSGTGKSTHTALWQRVYPGTVIVNDDAPAFRKKGDVWYIYGTPWAGTSGINANVCAPLKALVFLERSDVNKIRPLSALEGIKRIFEAIIHPVSDELMGIILSSVSSFMSLSQMCVLGCNMSEDAPKTVKEFLYK